MLAHLVAKEMLILEDSNFEKSFPNKSHRLERSDTPRTLHVLTHVHPLTPSPAAAMLTSAMLMSAMLTFLPC